MTNLLISIGTFNINVRSITANGADLQKTVEIQIDWRSLRESWSTTKAYTLGRLRNFLNERYTTYKNEKQKEFTAKWPPHSLFCEKRCCQRSFNGYIRALKKDLSWGKDGHIQS